MIRAGKTGSGGELHDLIRELYPICRSRTGNGVRETLSRLGRRIPLEVREVPSGTRVFDWTVPKEWNIRDAWVIGPDGEKVIDFRASNLHVVSYSLPVHETMPLAALKEHLHTLPDQPARVPYRTAYSGDGWGFCLSHDVLLSLPEGEYEVFIDSSLENGAMTYGELYLEGTEPDEVLISTHICHPSLCNDNLSGIAVATFLAQALMAESTRLSYRFLFIPGTIGSITWLATNQEKVDRIQHGLVLSCLGDPGELSYKRSRRGDAMIDRAACHVLGSRGEGAEIRGFSPYGYEERQFCSPGFDLPVGCLSRTPWGEFEEYHTSADDLSFVHPEALEGSLEACLEIVGILETDLLYLNTNPMCEPRLGERGLWKSDPGTPGPNQEGMAILWVLNLSDGKHSLMDVAERSGIPFPTILDAARLAEEKGLLQRVRTRANLDGS